MIEHGDPKLSKEHWAKVIVPDGEGDQCWEWEGARKWEDRNAAIIHYAKGRVTTLRMYYAEVFYDIDKETQKTHLTCKNGSCANPNHVKVFKKGECVEGHTNAKRYANGQCAECRRLRDAAIPRTVIAERARNYRKGLTEEQRAKKAEDMARRRKKDKEAAQRRKNDNVSIFNDTPLEKPWRPAGWPEEILGGKVKVNA